MKWNKKINVIIILTIIYCLLVPNNVVAANKKTTIKLNKSSVTLKKDLSITLKVTTNAKASKVRWSTSNKKIVKIKQNGKKVTLTGLKNGKATITCKIGSKKKTCKVTVKKNSKTYTEKEICDMLDKEMKKVGFTKATDIGTWGLNHISVTDPMANINAMIDGMNWQGFTYYNYESQGISNGILTLKFYCSGE